MCIVGIDLGTTNSLIGVWRDRAPVLIPNAHDSLITPSVVGVDDEGHIMVGLVARERLITHPHQTVANFKRWMGSARGTSLGKQEFLPEELSSLVLRSLVRDAERFLGHEVHEAVISVPAYFNDAQRKATQTAGRLAGLKVERIINEPTAAALAYGLENEDDTTTMIFDLGGGTFDVTLLEQFEKVIEVHASAGDNHLGGEDFNGLLVHHLKAKHDLTDAVAEPHVAKAAEQIKIALTKEHETEYTIPFGPTPAKGTYSRREFEELIAPLITRLRKPLERALRDSGFSVEEIDHVILAGGSTRVPLIRQVVGGLLRKMPLSHLNPDEIVALGAAVQAGLKARNEDLKDVVLTDVCPFTLGVGSLRKDEGFGDEAVMSPIIERNATIPTSRNHFFSSVDKKQKVIELPIYQGESLKLENNIKLGTMKIDLPRSKEIQNIDVRFTYDINGILEVQVTTLSNARVHQMVLNTSGVQMSDEDIQKRLKELEDIKLPVWEQEKNRMLFARSERLYEELQGESREILVHGIGDFRRQLNEQSLRPEHEQRIRQEFSQFLDTLDRPVL